MTIENCHQFAKSKKQRSLRSILGITLLGATLFGSVGVHQSHAGIIESATENTQSRNKGCSGIDSSRDIKRAGQTAFKHWINRCGERSELEKKKTKIGETYWYGWSTFVPLDWNDTDDGNDIITQFAAFPTPKNFRTGCGAVGSYIARNLAAGAKVRGISRDSMDFVLQHAGDSAQIDCERFPLAKISEMRGKWVDFVMNVKWTGNKDGFLKFWVKIGNGPYVQKIDYQGRTFWNDEGTGPYFKMGLYKGDPNFKGPAPRVIYTDEYRLGDANSSFGQVAP